MKTFVLTLLATIKILSAYTPQEVVTLTILAEARGEGKQGMAAVAQTILNRSHNRNLSVDKVCLQRLQFSCWNDQTAILCKAESIMNEDKQITNFAFLLADAICKDIPVYSNFPYNHYFNPDKADPKWGRGKSGLKIGKHLFLKL